jgi:hypothetical protein
VGYDVHITRQEHWSDGIGPFIAESEWQAYCASDPEMKITGVAEASLPGTGVLRIENPGLTEWRRRSDGALVWFNYSNGRVDVKNPDEETIAKMVQIAKALAGKVQGDEGELYS